MRLRLLCCMVLAGMIGFGCPSSKKQTSSPEDGDTGTQQTRKVSRADVVKDAGKPMDPEEAKFRKAFIAIMCLYRKEDDPAKIAAQQKEIYQQAGYQHAFEYAKAVVKFTEKKGYLKRLERKARAADCR